MSEKAGSVDQMDQAEEPKLSKPPSTVKQHSKKLTNSATTGTVMPSAFLSYKLNQAAISSTAQSDGKHHHHSHHTTPHVIHKTTSESLRLGSEIGGSASCSNSTSLSGTSSSGSNPPVPLNISFARKPKTSSFQITSVTVGNKLSADNGEDSADDLDESHTDDISRNTDIENETPSFSEDTFSKEDVFFSNSALGTAPVIPTSSQYGLVIVDPDLNGVGCQPGQSLSNVHVSVTDAGINIVGSPSGKLCDSDQKDMQHRNERFKVVKIESTEPFKRGRWMCMDYLDHSALQNSDNTIVSGNNTTSATQPGAPTNDSNVVIAENHNDVSGEPSDSNVHYNVAVIAGGINVSNSPGQTLKNTITVGVIEHQSQTVSNAIGGIPVIIHAQTIAHSSNVAAVNVQQQNIVAQSLPPGQIHQSIAGQQPQQPGHIAADYQHSGTHIQGQSQPAHFYLSNQHNQTSASNMHGATLPSNINIHNGAPSSFIPRVQQQSQIQSQSILGASAALSTPASVSEQNPTNIAPPNTSSNMPQSTISAHQSTIISQSTTMPQSAPQSQLSSDHFISNSVGQSYPGSALVVNSLPNSSTSSGLPLEIHHVDVNSAQQHTALGTMVLSVNTASNAAPQIISAAVEGLLQKPPSTQSPHQVIATLIQENVQPITILADGASSALTPQQVQNPSSVNLPLQQPASNAEDDQQAPAEAESESASGTSAVAIDNKIEQAMDLVKSHLMIAVREEVEVLKEKIAELMDRINQLELENTILKANVSQETLSQLSTAIQTASAKVPQNPNTSNGPVL